MDGQMILPMCKGCRKAKPTRKLILVGTVNQVEKERELQRKKKARKAQKGAATLPAEFDKDDGEASPVSGGGSGRGGGSGDGGGGSGGGDDGGGGKRKQREPTSQREALSSNSGAAKRRAKRAATVAAANPPSLSELVVVALPSFVQRGQHSVYRSMLRAAVKKIDPVKPVRAFGDKEEWLEGGPPWHCRKLAS